MISMAPEVLVLPHRVPRHIWGHGFVKVGDTDLKRRFQVSWCEIINYSIITITHVFKIQNVYDLLSGTPVSFREMLIPFYPRYSSGI